LRILRKSEVSFGELLVGTFQLAQYNILTI